VFEAAAAAHPSHPPSSVLAVLSGSAQHRRQRGIGATTVSCGLNGGRLGGGHGVDCPNLDLQLLLLIEPRVDATQRNECFVRSLLHHASTIDHHHTIRSRGSRYECLRRRHIWWKQWFLWFPSDTMCCRPH